MAHLAGDAKNSRIHGFLGIPSSPIGFNTFMAVHDLDDDWG